MGMFEHKGRARLLQHLSFGLVMFVVLIGVLRVGLRHWREGSVLLGGALLLAALLRAVLPAERSGLLAIRSRLVDVGLYGTLGALIVAVAMTITGGPFGR
jgi:hypothetical protein